MVVYNPLRYKRVILYIVRHSFRPMITKLGPREKGRKTKGKKKPRLIQQSKSKLKFIKQKYMV